MRFPWANTLLLLLIGADLATGFFGLVSGSPDRAIFLQLHRVAGYGILAVLAWKSANVLLSLRRRRPAAPRAASAALLGFLLLTLALGLLWSISGPFAFSLFSGLSWHIYVGGALVPVLIWHSLYHTRGFPIRFWVDRRSFLRLTALAAAGAVAWQTSELVSRLMGLSGAQRRFTGSYQPDVTAAGVFPVVSWLNDRPPSVNLATWRLCVEGTVERKLELTLEDLDDTTEVTAAIDCTGGWYSLQAWRGVPVATLLEAAAPAPGAARVTFTSATGYYRRFSLTEARNYLLATHVGGSPLSSGRIPAATRRPGKTRLRVGKMGRTHTSQHNPQMAPTPSTPPMNSCPVALPKPESTEGHRWTA